VVDDARRQPQHALLDALECLEVDLFRHGHRRKIKVPGTFRFRSTKDKEGQSLFMFRSSSPRSGSRRAAPGLPA
jgi:hypothetical protein